MQLTAIRADLQRGWHIGQSIRRGEAGQLDIGSDELVAGGNKTLDVQRIPARRRAASDGQAQTGGWIALGTTPEERDRLISWARRSVLARTLQEKSHD